MFMHTDFLGTFVETGMPVVDHQRSQNKVVSINAMNSVEQVYSDICQALNDKFSQIGKITSA